MALAAALALIIPILANANRAGAADSSVSVVHGIPGVDVDVYVGGNLTLPGFTYGTTAGPLSLPAGDYQIQVFGAIPSPPALAADRVDAAVIDQTETVPSGVNASIVANIESGSPQLSVFLNDVSAVAEGSTRVTVRHVAQAPAVNVLVNGTVAIPNLQPGAEASAVLPAGTYDIQVQLLDGTPVAALSPGSVTLPLAQNGLIVYATGSLDGDSLGLVQQTLDLPVAAATTTTAPPAAQGVTATPAVTG
jgi:hypothetical protein